MSSSERGFFQVAVFSTVLSLLLLSLVSHVADRVHPALPCFNWEKKFWRGREGFQRFDRVSSFFWSSLCGDESLPLAISASEGTVEPAFISYLAPFQAREFTGSHRGMKTFGYLAAHQIHPDRLKNLRILAFINPVYFSFAASSDAASIRLNAISNLAYVSAVPSFKQKWDAFLLDSFYVGTKSYSQELLKFRDPPFVMRPLGEDTAPSPPADADYDFERNMLKEMAPNFTSYRSRFSPDEEPTHTLFKQALKFTRQHPEVPVCMVLLPVNTKNLRHFGRDTKEILQGMEGMFERIPAGKGLNLLDLGETPKIFMDPMHFTPYGIHEIMKRLLASDCARAVLRPGTETGP